MALIKYVLAFILQLLGAWVVAGTGVSAKTGILIIWLSSVSGMLFESALEDRHGR